MIETKNKRIWVRYKITGIVWVIVSDTDPGYVPDSAGKAVMKILNKIKNVQSLFYVAEGFGECKNKLNQ